ncbi:hypothetical protein ScalyP_jg1944 [Parmales sp. scaly parma]|nr:hypothetical protein ScalyP_jg1944 [Parmales sp. scaly parma]
MFEHSTRPKLYFATDSIAHGSLALTFSSLAHKFFPKTAEKLQFLGALSPTSLSVIFDKLLVDLLPMASAIRVFTEFIKSGVKVLFRYGLALISMHKKVIKNGMFSDGGMLWGKIAELNSEANFSFDKLQLIAFQKVWGKSLNQRGFPRSKQLARYFKSHEEEARGINYRVAGSSANETDETPPLIITNSEHASAAKLCTSATARKSIARWVPRNLRGRELDLVFTTNVHGRALANLYLALEKSRGREFLTLVEVLDGNKGPTTIGMFSDARWQISSSVYGGGGCFVFKLSPQPKCFVWGGGGGGGGGGGEGGGGVEKMSEKDEAALELFMMSNNEYISMGGNVEGGAALRINEDLTKGFSDKTSMFGNPELVEGGEFEIGTVEVFAFKRMY